MNGYICHYRGKQCEVYAQTSYAAQCDAARIFKTKKTWEVSVTLAEKNGVSVLHAPQDVAP